MAKDTNKHLVSPPALARACRSKRARIAICAAHGNKPDELLEIMHDLQHELGHVPESVLPVIANALNLSRAEVYGVVTFYHDFHRHPVGKHVIKICRAEACQAMGTDDLCDHAEKTARTSSAARAPTASSPSRPSTASATARSRPP